MSSLRTPEHSYKIAGAKFVPEELYGEGFKLDSTRYDKDDWTFVPCPEYPFPDPCPDCGKHKVHAEQIFIAVSAVCTPHGSKYPKAAIGIYFARDSHFNIGVCVAEPKLCHMKTQLHACLRALHETLEFKMNGFTDLEGIVIKTDSDYIVRHMTDCIVKWRQNGFKNSKGSFVSNADLFIQIDSLIGHLNNLGVEVLFWQVGRFENEEADALASAAICRTVQSHFQQNMGLHRVSGSSTPQPLSGHVTRYNNQSMYL